MLIRKFFYLILIIGCASWDLAAHAQQKKAPRLKIWPILTKPDPLLDSLIDQYDLDSLKGLVAVDVFREYRDHHVNDARAWLYLGRAYDHAFSFIEGCDMRDSSALLYEDSAMEAYKHSEKLQPGIQDVRFCFTVPQMIGHCYGKRAMWALKLHDFQRVQWELRAAKAQGGFPGALLPFARKFLDPLPQNAILITTGDDEIFPIWYLQYVEGVRPDVTVLNSSLLNLYWYQNVYRQGIGQAFPIVEFEKIAEDCDSLSINSRLKGILKSELVFGNRKDTLTVDPAAIVRWKQMLPDITVPAQVITDAFRTDDLIPQQAGSESDLALIRIIKSNGWKRPIFFVAGSRIDDFHSLRNNLYEHVCVNELLPVDLSLPMASSSERATRIDKAELLALFNNPKWIGEFSVDTLYGQYVESQCGQFVLDYFTGLRHLDQALIDSVMPEVRRVFQTRWPNIGQGYLRLLWFLNSKQLDVEREIDWGIASLRQRMSTPTASLTKDHYTYGYLLGLRQQCDELHAFLKSIEWAKAPEAIARNTRYYDQISGLAFSVCPR